MLPVSAEFLAALSGSHTPTVQVDAWYGGQLAAADLPISEGATLGLDASRLVQGQITGMTVADPDGVFDPLRSETGPLSTAGARLHVTAGIEGLVERCSLGWFRVTRSVSSSRMHPYVVREGEPPKWVTRGGTVQVDADSLMWQVDQERFMAPESPKVMGSVLGEVKRLLSGIVALGSTAGVTDKAVPASVVYTDSRSKAVVDLLSTLDAVPRVSPDLAVDVVPVTPGASVWTIAVGDGGAYVDAVTELRADDLPNAAVSSGTTPAGLPVLGTALETGGVLRFGGPHGRIPRFHSSPLITSSAIAAADARTVLRSAIRDRAQVLDVTCLPNPALQLYDSVTLRTPVGDLVGQTIAISYPLSPGPMQLKVAVPRTSLVGLWAEVI